MRYCAGTGERFTCARISRGIVWRIWGICAQEMVLEKSGIVQMVDHVDERVPALAHGFTAMAMLRSKELLHCRVALQTKHFHCEQHIAH